MNFNVTVRLERLDEEFIKSATCGLIYQNQTQNNKSNSPNLEEEMNKHCKQFNTFEVVPLNEVKRSHSPADEKFYVHLSPQEQTKVDVESVTGCHFSTGARVLAKWTDNNYYPGNIVSRSAVDRYQVRFCDGVVVRDIESDYIIALSQLNVDEPMMLKLKSKKTKKDLYQPVKISSCPNIENTQEWYEGIYEVYNVMEKVKQKVPWKWLKLDPLQIVNVYFARIAQRFDLPAVFSNSVGCQTTDLIELPATFSNSVGSQTTSVTYQDACQQSDDVIVVEEDFSKDETKDNVCSFLPTTTSDMDVETWPEETYAQNSLHLPAYFYQKQEVTDDEITVPLQQQEEITPAAQPPFQQIFNNPQYNMCLDGNRSPEQVKAAPGSSNNISSRCNKCGVVIICHTPDSKQLHCLDHLNEEHIISNWFKCLLCEEKFRSLRPLLHHLKLKHQIDTPSNENYTVEPENCAQEVELLIEQMMKECFLDSSPIVTPVNACNSKSKVTCADCFVEVNNVPQQKILHVLHHVKEKTSVKWVFRCLLCPPIHYNCGIMSYITLRAHFRRKHPNVNLKKGINYFSREDEVSPVIEEKMQFCFNSHRPSHKSDKCTQLNKYKRSGFRTNWNDGENLYKCLHCKMEYSILGLMKFHIESKHNIDNPSENADYVNYSKQCYNRDSTTYVQQHYNHLAVNQIPNCFSKAETIIQCAQTPSSDAVMVKCAKCLKDVHYNMKKVHVMRHIHEETDIKWLFKCLLCPCNSFRFRTMYQGSFRRHFREKHSNVEQQHGVNCINRSEENMPLFYDIIRACFGNSPKSTPSRIDVSSTTVSAQHPLLTSELVLDSSAHTSTNTASTDTITDFESLFQQFSCPLYEPATASSLQQLEKHVANFINKSTENMPLNSDVIGACFGNNPTTTSSRIDVTSTIAEQRPLLMPELHLHSTAQVSNTATTKDFQSLFQPLPCPWYEPGTASSSQQPEMVESGFTTQIENNTGAKMFDSEPLLNLTPPGLWYTYDPSSISQQPEKHGVNFISNKGTENMPLISDMIQACFGSSPTNTSAKTAGVSSTIIDQCPLLTSELHLHSAAHTTNTAAICATPDFQTLFHQPFSSPWYEHGTASSSQQPEVVEPVFSTQIKNTSAKILESEPFLNSTPSASVSSQQHPEETIPAFTTQIKNTSAEILDSEPLLNSTPSCNASILKSDFCSLSTSQGNVSNEWQQFSGNVDTLTCKKCGKTGSSGQNFKMLHCLQHLRAEYKNKIESLLKCLHCKKTYQTFGQLKFHIEIKHRIRGFAQEGVNYVIEPKIYAGQIEHLIMECFDNNSSKVKNDSAVEANNISANETRNISSESKIISAEKTVEADNISAEETRNSSIDEAKNISAEKTENTLTYKTKKLMPCSGVWRVKCLKCSSEISSQLWPKECHVMKHIRKETNIKWVYQCLLCQQYNKNFNFMSYRSVYQHFKLFHYNMKPKIGTNCLSKRAEIMPLIKKMVKLCFEGQIRYRKLYSTASNPKKGETN